MNDPNDIEGGPVPPSPFRAGLAGRCPRCGVGPLFAGFLDLRPACTLCGLDYGFADSGDGPAVLIVFLVGAIGVGLALFTEFTWHPPFWVHALLWIPLILGLSLGLLRPLKGLTIATQYRHRAQEGRISKAD